MRTHAAITEAVSTQRMDLPDEIILCILGFLPCVVVRFSAGAVSRQWRRVAADAALATCLTEFDNTTSGVCDCAAEKGHLACLMYARAIGCPWSKDTLCYAALGGCLDCLTYAHLAGAPCYDEQVCWSAAEGGSLACLTYARDVIKCTWDEGTIDLAARNGHLHILVYAEENDCPCSEWAHSEAAKNGHTECLQFIYDHYYE
ncbi:F-box domain containing protein [Pandoravirus salinus]|uniref:F-box domain containing protein n=1 Tax=Pandoravirus salinus TaxID=1349410 RepID=S4W5Q1_9VIRU|nr:F-box domain [Pandoravirus salinus]AGO85705.1 F-box domain containing protein [Pandoravirus salinus]